jgi:DNA uptake protein ComE-like DNA-binding protein
VWLDSGDGIGEGKYKETIYAIKELKAEVEKVRGGAVKIEKKLQISQEVQTKIRKELADFRRCFEEKMVEELDCHKEKINILQEVINEQDEKVLVKIQEKHKIEAELAAVKAEKENMKDIKAESEKLKLDLLKKIDNEKKLESQLDEIEV